MKRDNAKTLVLIRTLVREAGYAAIRAKAQHGPDETYSCARGVYRLACELALYADPFAESFIDSTYDPDKA